MTRYHFIGIGGAGLSPIARVLLERGHQVSGSDLVMSPMAQELKEMGVKVSIGHAADNVFGADMIIRSSAIHDTNEEVAAGMNAHVPVVKRSEFLDYLTNEKEVVALAGTHGKTTTTAMVAFCLSDAKLDPSYVIGGVSKNLGTNAHAGEGRHFVIEADEYDRMFLGLAPKVLAITNIEHDHPDCFPTEAEYFQAFHDLTKRIIPGGILLLCADHPGTKRLAEVIKNDLRVFRYGTAPESDYMISNIRHAAGCGVSFRLSCNQYQGEVTLPIAGNHNAYNASAAIAVAHLLGIPPENAVQTLYQFSGTGRRFDILGTANHITVIDDYAHHPTEIRATLSAARCRYPDQSIWAVWQPHTYSRTQTLINEFRNAFSEADHVIVTEIYASREKPQAYSSKEVLNQMKHPDAIHISSLEDVNGHLTSHLKPGDVLLVLSAGDAYQISRKVFQYLRAQERENHD